MPWPGIATALAWQSLRAVPIHQCGFLRLIGSIILRPGDRVSVTTNLARVLETVDSPHPPIFGDEGYAFTGRGQEESLPQKALEASFGTVLETLVVAVVVVSAHVSLLMASIGRRATMRQPFFSHWCVISLTMAGCHDW